MTTLSSKNPNFAIAKPRFLPRILIEARAEIFNPLKLTDLGKNARRVLHGIFVYLNQKKPDSSIFPKRSTLCADSMLFSLPTLYRGLKELEQKGYIKREQIRKKHNGRFHLSLIHILQKTLSFLEPKKDQSAQKIQVPSLNLEDGQYKEHTNNNINKTPVPASQKICPKTRLPIPLLPLLQLGLKPSAVCWLMKLAKENCKRLEDVLNTKWGYFSSLSGSQAVGYIARLLKGLPKDSKRSVATPTCKQKTPEELWIDRLHPCMDRLLVIDRDGKEIGTVDYAGKVICGSEGSLSLDHKATAEMFVRGQLRFEKGRSQQARLIAHQALSKVKAMLGIKSKVDSPESRAVFPESEDGDFSRVGKVDSSESGADDFS